MKVLTICKNCGKEIWDYPSNHKIFCNNKCKSEYQIKQADDHKIKNCIGCGKEFRPKENRTRFCSLDCYYSFIRENSYTKKARECKWCGKKYYPNHYKKQFCSKECGYAWYSEFKKTDEQVKLQTEKVIKTISGGRMKKAFTKPHVIVDGILEHIGVKRIDEYNIKYYAVDVYLPENDLMIEVMGDYWHTNPTTKFVNSKSEAQIKITNRDRRKHTYVKNKYGIEILYLWESDIEYNTNMCEELIKLYINNNGVLQDYNSYNYELEPEGIVLKDNIIQPLFLYNNCSAS